MPAWLTAWLDREGSTRAVALMRIAFVALIWTRFADHLLPFRHANWDWWLASLAFFPLSLAAFVGWRTRATLPAFAATMWYIVVYLAWKEYEPWTHHHVYALLYALTLLVLTPAGSSFSVDRWRTVRAAERAGAPVPAELGQLWAVPLLKLHVSVMYAFSAYDKSSWAFLSGERLQQILMYLYAGSDYPAVPFFAAFTAASAWVVVLGEFTLAVALWVPATRRYAIIAGLALHALFYVAMPVGIFSLTMAALYLAFVDDAHLHLVINRLMGVR